MTLGKTLFKKIVDDPDSANKEFEFIVHFGKRGNIGRITNIKEYVYDPESNEETKYHPKYPWDIKAKHATTICAWIYELGLHRDEAEKTVTDILSVRTFRREDGERNWYSHFRKGVMKRQRLLPEFSLNPQHIALEGYDTIYDFLGKVHPDRVQGRTTVSEDKVAFVSKFFAEYMPGIMKLKALRPKTNGTARVKFANKIKTDGAFISIVCEKIGRSEETRGDEGNDGKRLDMNSPNQPTKLDLSRGDRLIAFDPGNRDIVVGVDMTTKESEKEIYKFSLKQHLHETKRLTSRMKGTGSLKKEMTKADYKIFSGRKASSGNVSKSGDYLEHIKRRKGASRSVLKVKMTHKWRERKGWYRGLCDASIDKFCHKVMKGTREGGTTYVAFGAANVSAGMGYASAPHKRLRHRLEYVHGAKVTLIEEFRTSLLLRGTTKEMKTPLKRKPSNAEKGWWKKKENQMYGVLCFKKKGKKTVYVHRDVNAAKNIGDIYKCLASTGKRPYRFTRRRTKNK